MKKDLSKKYKKRLTGWEAGLLVFEGSWRVYRGENPLFCDSEVESFRNNFISPDYKNDYKRAIDLWKTAGQIFRLAMFDCMMAAWLLERLTRSVQTMTDMSLFADMASMNCNASTKTKRNHNVATMATCFKGWPMPPINDGESSYEVEEGI
ncbi:MAG: hypothetical protein GY845_14305, partial [Planctomycetes bacterium]|nr:hypothetical protein [Planctomycetota bacterium]